MTLHHINWFNCITISYIYYVTLSHTYVGSRESQCTYVGSNTTNVMYRSELLVWVYIWCMHTQLKCTCSFSKVLWALDDCAYISGNALLPVLQLLHGISLHTYHWVYNVHTLSCTNIDNQCYIWYHKWRKFGVAKVWRIWQNCIFRKILFIQSLIFPDISGKFAKLYATKLIVMQFCQPIATPNFRRLQYLFMLHIIDILLHIL